MFCEGLSLDATGRIVATGGCSNRAYTGLELTMAGGNDAAETSIYDPLTSAWTAEGLMQIPRGYQSVSKHLKVHSSYILSRRTGHKSKALRKPVSDLRSGPRRAILIRHLYRWSPCPTAIFLRLVGLGAEAVVGKMVMQPAKFRFRWCSHVTQGKSTIHLQTPGP